MSNELLDDNTQVDEVVEQESPIGEAVESQQQSDSFHSQLPEDLRNDSSLQDFKSLDDLAKSYVNATRMIGNSVRIPSEEAGQEAWQDFYGKLSDVPGVVHVPVGADSNSGELMKVFDKLGRPESPDGYSIEMDPSIQPMVQEEVSQFTQVAHEAGLTKQQAAKLAEWRLGAAEQHLEGMANARKQAESSLQQKWGQDYDNRMAGAKAAARHYANEYGDSFAQLLDGPAGNHPALIEILSTLGENMRESGTVESSSTPNGYGITPQEAAEKIADFRSNAEQVAIYRDVNHPDHKAVMEKITNLYRIKSGG